MVIASEIKQKLPKESALLERRVKLLSDCHESQVYVAQAEYQALMDAPSVENGKPLDNGRARVFNFEYGLHPSIVQHHGHTWVFADEGPGRDAYDSVVWERETKEGEKRILPYFREDIHLTYIHIKQLIKTAANRLITNMIKSFYGDDYRGIYLFASKFSEGKPAYVPDFTLGKESGHWDYAADFSIDGKLIAPPAQIIDNPWAFDDEISEIISREMRESHKATRFVQWAIGMQPPPEAVKLGAYDIVYVSDEPGIEDESEPETIGTIGIAPKLARVGGLVVAEGNDLSDILLHGHRNLKPFFTAERRISEAQFLMKTK